jgi:hypothetical protein
LATGIPEQVHHDYFEQLHPDLPKRVNGTGTAASGLGKALSFFSAIGDFFSFANGNPESFMALFPCIGCDPESFTGKVQKIRRQMYITQLVVLCLISKIINLHPKRLLTIFTLALNGMIKKGNMSVLTKLKRGQKPGNTIRTEREL